MRPYLPIHTIHAGTSNVYLIPNGSRSILVDTGVPGHQDRILRSAADLGISPADITLILITHAHFDHTGSLAALKAATRAQVLVHTAEADYLLKGSSPFPAGTNLYGKVVAALGRRFFSRIAHYSPLAPDLTISNPSDLSAYGLDACLLPTPGHTRGSLSLILQDRAAIVGDTLFGIYPHTAFPPFANDIPVLLESWKLLLSTGCQTFLPGHGRPVNRSLLERSLAHLSEKNHRS